MTIACACCLATGACAPCAPYNALARSSTREGACEPRYHCAPDVRLLFTLPRHARRGAALRGAAVALGGVIRDVVSSLATAGILGAGLDAPSTGYVFVYLVEILLLFMMLAVVGPLLRANDNISSRPQHDAGRPVLAGLQNQHGALP